MKKNDTLILSLMILFLMCSCGMNYNNETVAGADTQNYYESSECVNVTMDELAQEAYLNVPYIKQGEKYCGPASLAMVLQYYGQDVDQTELGQDIVGEDGVLTSDLSQKATERGFRSDVYSCPIETLFYYVSHDIPVIVRIVNNAGTNGHFITVVGYDIESKTIYANDPGIYKNTEISFSRFKNIWNVRTLSEDNNSWNQMILVRPSL